MYHIIETCMCPSGAYAKIQYSCAAEANVRKAFGRAAFEGPGFGILWSKTLQLIHSEHRNGERLYEVLATRAIA